MGRAVFEIKQTPTDSYYFTFRGVDGDTQVISHSFPDRAELEKCLSCVRDVAPLADVCANLGAYWEQPFFCVQAQEDGLIFSLIGFNGEIIFRSVSYPDAMRCREAIAKLKAFARKAAIVDLTVD
ncbi:MAG: DUF1508 domain-containing protein [Candidatus Pelethousia sp.]|nr:DUF1508 domain-containing protein [Candidatus Pelethousia sp.]